MGEQQVSSVSGDGYYDLGAYHRPVTTASAEAQKWFDRGLIWSYAFNHEESARCFERAAEIDPSCAMAYWGLGYALGPNYNKPWEVFDEEDAVSSARRTHDALERAHDRAAGATPLERALIEALRFRYPQGSPAKDWSIWNQQYADAMGRVYGEFGSDLDVAALYADALMNLTPWKLWDLDTGEPAPGAHTLRIKDILEAAMRQPGGDVHPGLLHLYIHLVEMSSSPETALTAADRLRGLVPDAGHLNHMPSHIDILCGDYRRAVASNTDAVLANQKFVARAGAMNFYTLYRAHDYHFRIYAAMFAGQSKVALATATELEAAIPEQLLRVESPPMADWLEGFLAMRVHILIRFGLWEDIARLEFPKDRGLYCVTTAMIHYAKGVALAATGHVPEAEEQQRLFLEAVKVVPSSRTVFNNECRDILAVAASMLAGELEYRRANYDSAFENLRRSIQLDDTLPYDEPWGWMQPTRHAYGALLLEQGRVEEAAAVYCADLGFDRTLPRARQHPNNVWSLHGYHECLRKLGRTAEAGIVLSLLNPAMAIADVPIKSSCFCRTTVSQIS
ncbi:TPR domain protein [Coniochaeta hoffmannii]|uniref:TPR domain protein n=1 Tax=Coniochaeta hoffmannii TaxID=91930 RepID=A0AA38RY21_9PEZI|nr:TPR domain protein [Coniochaeta hoffmannii]